MPLNKFEVGSKKTNPFFTKPLPSFFQPIHEASLLLWTNMFHLNVTLVPQKVLKFFDGLAIDVVQVTDILRRSEIW